MFYFHCEICRKRKTSKEMGEKICRPCFGAFNRKFEIEQEERAAKWALSHKCRKCGVGLPLDRYYNCHFCDMPCLRETEDDFDGFSGGPDDFELPPQPAVKRYVAQPKACKKCGEVKEPNMFPKSMTCKDGRLNECKVCVNKRSLMATARRVAALAAKGAAQ